MKWINRASKLFQPLNVIPKDMLPKTDSSCKSYQLMINNGIISSSSTGMYTFLPLGMKSLQKLTQLIDEEMKQIGGQKILLPTLTQSTLWHQTSRLSEAKSELFVLNDRHKKEYLLSPTFEESIANMISQVGPLKQSQLPLRLYQISSKFRDEKKPRLGFLRSREFIMKDMYAFDTDLDNAKCTYEVINKAYEKIFKRIGIPYQKIIADTGIMGGSVSHEYHYISDIGEDVIEFCKKCNYYKNEKLTENGNQCPICKETMEKSVSVEVGHTFLLDTKYSKPLKANFINSSNKQENLVMGSYGIGLSRIIASAIEILSTDMEIRWPLELVPYSVCIIPPKKGSKEESVTQVAYDLYFQLENSNFDVIIDDRSDMTIGKRFIQARSCGYPFVIIVGKNYQSNSLFEVHNLYNNSHINVTSENITDHLKSFLNSSN